MPKPVSPGLLSVLSDPIWMTATDPLHVNTASGAWLYFDSSLAQPEFHPHDCGLLSGDGWPNITALPESWHRLQMHRVSQGPLTPLARAPAWPSGASRAGASHSSHLPACLPARHSTPLRPLDGLCRSCRYLLISSLPTGSYPPPRTKPMGHRSANML